MLYRLNYPETNELNKIFFKVTVSIFIDSFIHALSLLFLFNSYTKGPEEEFSHGLRP